MSKVDVRQARQQFPTVYLGCFSGPTAHVLTMSPEYEGSNRALCGARGRAYWPRHAASRVCTSCWRTLNEAEPGARIFNEL